MAERRPSRSGKAAAPKNGSPKPPPAYYLSVSVENIRCFGPKQTLDLSDGHGRPAQWTVILGDNGTGKTTLLHCLIALEPRYIRTQNDASFPKPYGPRAFVDLDVLDTWNLARTVEQDALLSRISADVLAESELQSESWGELFRDFHVEWKGGKGGSSVSRHSWWKELICYAYGASRQIARTSITESASDDPTATLIKDNVTLPNTEEWLLQADYAANRVVDPTERERAVRRRDQIIEVLVKLLPDVGAIRFAESRAPILVPRVEFKTPYGWVTLNQLSLGYRTMIAWTVDVARRQFERYPDSPNPLAEPAVVLVDEIDLHLHPKWQRSIMDFLGARFPNTQFIVTAHSPLVVQAATNANIAVLRREGDHVVIDNDVKAIRNWRVDQILTSDLFDLPSARPPHLDDLLEKRRALLSKSKLTSADRKKLKAIEAEIGDLPAGETPEEAEAMDIIRRAAERLKNEP